MTTTSCPIPAPQGCGRPPPLENGDTRESLRFSYSHGEQVGYTCQNLFTMEGQPVRTCSDGQWEGQMKCLSESPAKSEQ